MGEWLARLPDRRDPVWVTYPLRHVFWVGVFLFLFKLQARRQVKFLLHQPGILAHINRITHGRNDTVTHGDNLEKILRWLPWQDLASIRTEMMRRLLRMKALCGYRLLDRDYIIAVDGTGVVCFEKRHCKRCLTKTSNGKTVYYHPVLEAKLVTSTGLALSLETEFIENPEIGHENGKEKMKQDCELKAFYRMAARLKENFPQLRICLVLDALYAAKGVFDVCKKNQWRFIITFKKGSMPATYEDTLRMEKFQEENRITYRPDGKIQTFRWVNEIVYGDHVLHAIHCTEEKPNAKPLTFAWITNINASNRNVIQIANQGGRQRWKIENQGFNMQKNGGYNLEHAYSHHDNAGKNYYLLLQIAHIINQLIEKGSLLKNIRQACGSIKNIAPLLLESIRNHPLSDQEYEALFRKPFQIRLNTS